MAAIACAIWLTYKEPETPASLRRASSSTVSIPNSFANTQPLKEALKEPGLSLRHIDRVVKLPDLRQQLVSYGFHERPDREFSTPQIQFGLRGIQSCLSTRCNEKVYLRFDPRAARWQIATSPTPLFFILRPKDSGVEAEVRLQEDGKEAVTTPIEFHKFIVASATPPNGSQVWTLDTWSVDTSILERQGAVWYGQDRFVQELGGTEMEHEKSRERIVFTLGASPYVLWAKEKDCFTFEDGRWISVEVGSESAGKPLLMVTKIEQRSLQFSLWNEEGTQHLSLALQRRDPGNATLPEIKVLGAKSRKQWLAEIQGQKVTFRPDDWIVCNGKEIVTISTQQQLDDYLEGRLSGHLLALQGITKEHGEPRLVGSFFDATHTVSLPISASLYRSWEPPKLPETTQQPPEDDPFLDDEDFDSEDDGEFSDE